MKNYAVIAVTALLTLTACACSSKSKREAVLEKALAETNRRYDYSRDQNERYSRELHVALAKAKKGK